MTDSGAAQRSSARTGGRSTGAGRGAAEVAWDDWTPLDRATLVFVIDAERVLLIRKKRGLGAGKISGPGGRIEPGESPEQCAVRETREELGIEPIAPEHVGELWFQFVDGYSLHVHVFRSEGFAGEPRETEEAVPMWHDVGALPYDEMWEDDRHWLPHLLSRRGFVGRFVFDGDRLLHFEVEVKGRDQVDEP